MKSLLLLAISYLAVLALATGNLEIVPGATWTVPNTGKHLQAHGAGIIKVDDTFYIIGENKTTGALFQSVSCYKSKDLVQWEFVNDLLTNTNSDPDLRPDRIIERPKVIYNKNTGKYVLWMHVDSSNYGYARAGVAWSDTVCGDYTYVRSYRPLDQYISRDQTVYVDDDGTGYLLGEDRPTGLIIFKLSEDYLSIDSLVYNFYWHIESPAIFKHEGVYYVLGSSLTGWNANDNYYTTSESLSGPWTNLTLFTPAGSKTFTSQTTYVQRVGKTFIYMGDRWTPNSRAGLGASTYIWLPLTLNSTTRSLNLTWYDAWSIDPRTGTLSFPNDKIYEAEAPENKLENGTWVIQNAGFLNNGTGVTGLGGSNYGKLTITGITKSIKRGLTTIRMYYKNDAPEIKYAQVRVGGQDPVPVAFLPTNFGAVASRPATVNVTTVHSFKFEDKTQELVIEGLGNANTNYTADIDLILVETR